MRALVTGGTGFVGRPVVRRLLRDSWQVTLVTRDVSRLSRPDSEGLDVIEADIADPTAVFSIAEACRRVDTVIHLAACLDYYGVKDTYRINVAGTGHMLEVTRRVSAKRFVYASSIEAIGPVGADEVPASPETPCRPVSAYGASKVAAERLVRQAASSGFPAVILRIGNVYGPGHLSFVSDVAEAILTRNRLLEFLPVYAERYIHPIHNRDVTEGILAACGENIPTSTLTLAGEYATVGRIFEITSRILGRPLPQKPRRRTDELFLMLRREYHRRGNGMDFITYLMAPSGRRIHRAYSMKETFQVLDLPPQVPLQDGIADTLAWIRNERIIDPGNREA
jgi:nucleoside-diphosphate-sugar epimerase